MRVLLYCALTGLLIFVGGQFRIAKITIKERASSRIVFRLCRPNEEPDVFNMTDDDFMCLLYDWYGLRRLGGFGKATK